MADETKPAGTPVKECIDILLYDDPQGIRKRKVIFELQSSVKEPTFAEDFLENDGLTVITQLLKTTTGSIQGGLLQVLRGLLVYVNAMEQISENHDLVDKIYHLLMPPGDGEPVNLSVAKPTLEILIVIVAMLPDGHKLVNEAAKRRIGVGASPYSPLVGLLEQSDLLTVRNTLLFMNMLMKKKKERSDVKAKKLMFRWKEAGVLRMLKPLTVVEDEEIQKQIAAFQKLTAFVIPRSWEEAAKYKQQYEEARRRYDAVSDQLFVFQQQQAKMRLLKQELARAQETIKAMSLVAPAQSTTFHPTKRFAEGGGLSLGELLNGQIEHLDSTGAANDIAEVRKKIFQQFVSAPDFKMETEKILGPVRRGRGGRGGYDFGDSDDDFGPPDDDFGPPPDDDLGPPPDDDIGPPPDDDLGPPPDDDFGPPPDDDFGGGAGGPGTGPGGKAGPGGVAGGGFGEATVASSGIVMVTLADGTQVPATDPAAAAVDPEAYAAATAAAAAADPYAAAVAAAEDPYAAAAAPEAAADPYAAAAPAAAPPPPPPPPPGGRLGGPPPPPPMGKFGGGAGAKSGPTDTRQYYHGPQPQKKMKPLHWEKYPMPAKDSIWHLIHDGKDVDQTFDYEEFELMYSQKEVTAKATGPPKPKKILLLDEKVNQNISIMLHKLPTIPNTQRALLELDESTLNRDALIAIAAQGTQIDEIKRGFLAKANTKPEEEYENTEKFVLMAINMPEFKKRCNAWLFSLEWEENAQALMKPIHKVNDATLSVLKSKYLPYYMGLLLGFGNMMNFGNATKGNAPAISITTLGKLDASKDNRGKTSLIQHLLNVVKTRNPDALQLAEELKPFQARIHSTKLEDLEKSVQEAEREVQIFGNQINSVKKALVTAGTDQEDPFVPRMAEFHVKAQAQLKQVQELFQECKSNLDRLIEFLGAPKSKPLKPEEVFIELENLVDKVKKAAAVAAKEKKRQANKGQTIGDANLSNVVGKLQEQVVN